MHRLKQEGGGEPGSSLTACTGGKPMLSEHSIHFVVLDDLYVPLISIAAQYTASSAKA